MQPNEEFLLVGECVLLSLCFCRCDYTRAMGRFADCLQEINTSYCDSVGPVDNIRGEFLKLYFPFQSLSVYDPSGSDHMIIFTSDRILWVQPESLR